MTVKERILSIRLIQKLEKNDAYRKKLNIDCKLLSKERKGSKCNPRNGNSR